MAKQVKVLVQKTLATLDDDGYWTVTADYISGENENDGPFDTRTIGAKAINKDLRSAVELATESLTKQFIDVQFNLYNIAKENDGTYIPNPLENNKVT